MPQNGASNCTSNSVVNDPDFVSNRFTRCIYLERCGKKYGQQTYWVRVGLGFNLQHVKIDVCSVA